MNTPDTEPTPAATVAPPEEATALPQPMTAQARPRKLSASTKAFLAQMAENLRTHDPENPKGRLRMKP